ALARVAAERRTAGDVERGGHHQPVCRQCGLDERLAHAASGPRDRKVQRHRAQCFLIQSKILPKNPWSSASGCFFSAFSPAARLSSTTDSGISSPSQRESFSSAKYTVNCRCSRT